MVTFKGATIDKKLEGIDVNSFPFLNFFSRSRCYLPLPLLYFLCFFSTSVPISQKFSTWAQVDCFVHTSDIARRQHLRSASSRQLFVPRHRCSMFGRRAFSVAGPAAWNSLLGDPTRSFDSFRSDLKTSFLVLLAYTAHRLCDYALCKSTVDIDIGVWPLIKSASEVRGPYMSRPTNKSDSHKSWRGPNTLGPQVFRSWSGCIPWWHFHPNCSCSEHVKHFFRDTLVLTYFVFDSTYITTTKLSEVYMVTPKTSYSSFIYNCVPNSGLRNTYQLHMKIVASPHIFILFNQSVISTITKYRYSKNRPKTKLLQMFPMSQKLKFNIKTSSSLNRMQIEHVQTGMLSLNTIRPRRRYLA